MLSKEFVTRLKLAETPQYKIAARAGVSGPQLSGWVNGSSPIPQRDKARKRLLKVGALLGLKPSEVFANIA